MYKQQQTLDDLILAMYDFCVLWITSMMLSYPQYPQSLFQPIERPSALQRLISKRKKVELSETARLILNPNPLVIAQKAQADFARCLHIPLA